MSRRITRLLLRMYPARFRRRYGDEIRDLSHELRTRSEISPARLLRDLAVSAIAARRPSAWSRLTAFAGVAAVAIAILAATGMLARSSHTSRAPVPPQRTDKPRVLTAQATTFGTCLVDAGLNTCSLSACTQLIRQRPRKALAARVVGSRTRSRCISNPRHRRPRPVDISG